MKTRKISLILAIISCGILIILSLLKTPQSLATQQARISRIIDGDTLEVTMSQCRIPWEGNSQLCRLQLACIDGPDYGDSPFFEAAKNRLETLIPRGTIVLVSDTGKSSRQRIVAEVFKDNTSINLQLVSEGKASLFCKHLNDTCPNSKTTYLNAQNSAIQRDLGVWNSQQSWEKSRICN
ncbi:MAG: thermonuclease family protein [Okeania sp. SIO3I5]|uniref:thermonuclease family protein n=1 Tax=Okeania sp. SIO3I5 TaxID=2607805 RepID=UPI0013B97E9F|nr:thermonuclease family protein [Okeania sp. SIO3I5]NEQ36540.1 thermonuclease family protein [Okeania sp. SIO3I5]